MISYSDAKVCHWCGDPFHEKPSANHPRRRTKEHIIPLARGGADTSDNITASHACCNNRRGKNEAWKRYDAPGGWVAMCPSQQYHLEHVHGWVRPARETIRARRRRLAHV